MFLQNLPLYIVLSAAITLVISLTIHEFAHAWTANLFGDDTPRLAGRLTLNPLQHLDLLGSVMLVIAGFGWAKPVPVNPYTLRRRSPAALMLVSLSGPLSNFLLAAIAALILRLNIVPISFSSNQFIPSLYQFFIYFIFTNLALMLFNLMPIPPLDGEEILSYLLPAQLSSFYDQLRPYGPLILMSILIIGPMFGVNLFSTILQPAIQSLAQLLIGA